ncbi:uncharacterized protein LOC124288039 [Haliotis rubra]|uniref:uncharacterized protein LOC124288039 n=1 Tax=Haliotis rubra TaxID=36100 RepID=UPI001EE5FBA4|nr:uncharacterized protein LOC124288039 [Haliotis rubra]
MIDVMARTCRHLEVPVLLLFILVLRPTVFSGEYVNFLYSDHLNGRLCSQGIRGEVADVTILDCTRACATDRLCISFIYDDTTSTCHLYNQALNLTSNCTIHADHYFSYYFKLVHAKASTEVIRAVSSEESGSSWEEDAGGGEDDK